MLRLAPVTLSYWRITGAQPGLRYTRIGRRIRYFESDVMDWARSRRHPVAEPKPTPTPKPRVKHGR